MSGHRKVFVKWKDVEKYIDELCLELERRNFRPTGVFGIPRGGLIFAVMLSHRLNIPMLASPMGNCIVVDDIADSGRSLVHYRQNDTMFLDTLFITTMYYSDRSMVKPDFYSKTKKSQGDWIVFPWENVETEGKMEP